MTLEKAYKLLNGIIGSDGRLSSNGLDRIHYSPGNHFVKIEGEFSAEKLEAIALVMRETPPKEG